MSKGELKTWDYVDNYSRHNDINQYLSKMLGKDFREYRQRWKNACELKTEYNFPLFLVVESMFRCNLRCQMCLHSSKGKQRFGYREKMPLVFFEKLIKEASRYYCPSMAIAGLSEPLLDKDLLNMIYFARRNGFIDIMVNTNATLLTSEISRRLIESGLTRLRIGFDGLTPSTYEKIRRGSDFAKVKDNIMNFMKIRDTMKSKLPVVRLSCVHMHNNKSEISRFVEFWKPIVDYVAIQVYRPHIFTKKRLAMNPNPKMKRKPVNSGLICSNPFERLYIRGNGDVYACCTIAYGPKVGNVFSDSLYKIWNSDKLKMIRQTMKNGHWHKLPMCKVCLSYSAL